MERVRGNFDLPENPPRGLQLSLLPRSTCWSPRLQPEVWARLETCAVAPRLRVAPLARIFRKQLLPSCCHLMNEILPFYKQHELCCLIVCNFSVVSTATNREHKMYKRFCGRPTFLPFFCELKVVLSLFVTCRNQRMTEHLPLAFVHLLLLETEARCRRGEGISRNNGRARAELRTDVDVPSSSAGCPPSPAAARLRGRAVNGRRRIDPGLEQSRPG